MTRFIEIGKRLRFLRENITQKDFAYKLGISHWAYRLYETGERQPPATLLGIIAKLYGTSIDWLVTGEEADKKEITVSEQQRNKLLKKQNYVCALCGYGIQDVLELATINASHIISNQDKNFELDNMILLCPNCNAMKKKSLLSIAPVELSALTQSMGRMNRRPAPQAFNKESLTWIRPRALDTCEENERDMEMERQSSFAKFIQKNINKILRVVGVSQRLLNCSYDGLSCTVVDTCKRSVRGKHGLYIYGKVGRGKSCLSVAILSDMLQTTKYSAEMKRKLMIDINKFLALYCFVPVTRLSKLMRDSYGDTDYQTVERVIEQYSTTQVLILDEIGMEKTSTWVRDKLNKIVDYRNNSELKTLYTSTKSPEELMGQMGEQRASEVFRQCEIIHLTGPNRRLQKSRDVGFTRN